MTLKEVLKKFLTSLKKEFPDILQPEEYGEYDVKKEGLDKIEHAHEKLVDPAILIDAKAEQELFTQHGFKNATTHPYPSNAVKALWNISVKALSIIEKGRVSAVLNAGTHTSYLFDLLKYLSPKDDYSIRVVDNKTLKLAKLYLNFITEILQNVDQPNFFEGISIPGVNLEGNCKIICNSLSTILSDLIKKYKARIPDPLDAKIRDHNEIFLMVNQAESAINYFEELHEKKFQPTAEKVIPIATLLANLKDFDFQSVIEIVRIQLTILRSPNRLKKQILYTPRINHNVAIEMAYLNGAMQDYVVFQPNRDVEEVIPNLTEYLEGLNDFAQRGKALSTWLANFIDTYLTIKLSHYETIIEMSSVLQNLNTPLRFTDEQYCQIISKFTFATDTEAIKQFLAEKGIAEGGFRVFFVKFSDFLERVRTTDMALRMQDAQRVLNEHVIVLLRSEIDQFISACNKDAVLIPKEENSDDQIKILITTLTHLKRLRENTQRCLTELQKKYAACPIHSFELLQAYLLSKDIEINNTLGALLRFVRDRYELAPVRLLKIESLEQKAEVSRSIDQLSIANEQISLILQFIQAQFDQNKDFIAALNTCLQNNKRNIEIYTGLINAFGDIECLVDQLYQMQTKKGELDRSHGRFMTALKDQRERKESSVITAGILITIYNLKIEMIGLTKVLDEQEHKRPQVDIDRQKYLETKLSELDVQLKSLTSNQSIFSNFINRWWGSTGLLFRLQSLPHIILGQIELYQSQLEQLNEPLLRHDKALKSLNVQKRKLEEKILTLQQEANSLLPEAERALTTYLECGKAIIDLTQTLEHLRADTDSLNLTIAKVQADLNLKAQSLKLSLLENSNELLIFIKHFAIFRLTPLEIIHLRMNYDNILRTLNINYLNIIQQKLADNPVTQELHKILSVSIYEIKVRIKEFEDCYKIHEKLAQLRHQIMDIYDECFVKHNPHRMSTVKSSSEMLANNSSSKNESTRSLRSSSPANFREQPFNKIDRLFRAYLNREGKYATLLCEIQVCIKASLGQKESKEPKTAAAYFFETLFKQLTDLDWEVRKQYSVLCEIQTIKPLITASQIDVEIVPMDEIMITSTHNPIHPNGLAAPSSSPVPKRP